MKDVCENNHSFFWPFTLIIVGVVLLLVNLIVLPPSFWRVWPGILIIAGVLHVKNCCDSCSGIQNKTKRTPNKKRK